MLIKFDSELKTNLFLVSRRAVASVFLIKQEQINLANQKGDGVLIESSKILK